MYDLVIIGGGPGGLSAGLYAGRARLNTLIIEKGSIGGQIGITDSIENYPGSLVGEHESGKTLTERMRKQAEHFGCDFVFEDVVEVDLKSQPKKITLGNGDVVEGKSVIIATGASPRKLNVPGEKEFSGKGVSYCATCDANFFEDFEVFVVGGGNSAVEEAIYLKKFARKVTIVVRRDVLRCDAVVKEEADNTEGLEFMYNTSIKEIHGDPLVNKLILVDNKTGEESEYLADEDDGLMGVFVFVGTDPQSEIFKGQVEMTDNGNIITDELMRTNIPLVYAIGDVRDTPLRQVVTAASDGSIAAVTIEKEIKTLK
ncbi:thioredoxin-disulfide reductase [Neofamilia massiliensis]|uniref:thioredoxin-disulfide reductase n=1 Tax=Neofamilia massiliensis TaxID=1673724 RepID=UPI0006BB8472|nr:thioredoxin-disulfide reductase [Neofamilia massiliensis]